MKLPIKQTSDGEAPLWHDADGKYIDYDEVTAILNRYAYVTKDALDCSDGRWMILDQSFDGASLEEGIDNAIKEDGVSL